MDYKVIIKDVLENNDIGPGDISECYGDEVRINATALNFKNICLGLHKINRSPVMMLFASDERAGRGVFVVTAVFMAAKYKKWFFVNMDVKKESPAFDSLSKEIYSATFFEREIKEMFGIEPKDHPDMRRLNLHDEVWPEGAYPLRKDFNAGAKSESAGAYEFKRIEGEGVFEVPVGPVHAGIIGPGHFRFSVAGEPIINLETRLGFTHRGVEKLMEGKDVPGAIRIAECVTGDSCFGHSLAFSHAVEKICGAKVPEGVLAARAIFLELERMYNHVADIGGIAIDVGFSFPSNHAAMIKETMLALNQKLTGSRYLKNINEIGGIKKNLSAEERSYLRKTLVQVLKDFKDLKTTLLDSVSFMDRADSTGVLRKKTAEDLGVVGLAARASGIPMDLRKDFPGIYDKIKFNLMKQDNGDALARLNVRLSEFEGSAGIIMQLLDKLDLQAVEPSGAKMSIKAGSALGYAEGWRGAILYWVKLNEEGIVERCKIVDPSFHNWAGLSFAVLGNIIPDFPLCNKSFNLSYPGNDL